MRAIVTGAAGALGKSVVDRFAGEGHMVACIDRIEGPASGQCRWFVVDDLANGEGAREHVGRAARWLGEVDALIHLVGAFQWKPLEETHLDEWRSLFGANIETAVSTIQALLPSLGRGAAIVTVGAASAAPAGAGMAPYAAAKSGVVRLTEALAVELQPRGIRVNSILPAVIDTPRNRAEMADADFSGWTSPDAIADAIFFLASPVSRAVNGAGLEVTNGGV